MTFGEKLKSLRHEKALTQEELANLLGTSKQIISLYESGQRIPKITVVQDFANKLKIPVSYFTEDDNPEILAYGGSDSLSPEAISHILELHNDAELRAMKNDIITAIAGKHLTKEQILAIKTILDSM